ncbi:hypothetical protein AVEN_22488-1 [Araneus ventricosus]|uniref:Uncharacterized protein n=1 Tax=Araneus ventricosus TaxID=182803 RepID=A0A4Y2W8W3_ARAVE|nr:hypothetical protein AVEN_274037-1 [Araneus ventricosus]GBO34103.1 hypothetical protein AVEN_22488-1 [Araneus ventricosus]
MVQLIFQKPDSMVQPSKMVQPFTMFWKLVSANQSKALFNRHFPGHALCSISLHGKNGEASLNIQREMKVLIQYRTSSKVREITDGEELLEVIESTYHIAPDYADFPSLEGYSSIYSLIKQ